MSVEGSGGALGASTGVLGDLRQTEFVNKFTRLALTTLSWSPSRHEHDSSSNFSIGLGGLSNMRFLGLAAVTAALALSACKKDEAAAPAADTAAAAAPAAPAATVAMAPITGKTWEVKMVGDATTYKYEPAELTIAPGDGIKFIMVSSGPHNVAFDPATISAGAKAQLMANMTEQVTELSGKYLSTPNEEYVISFAGVPAGTYEFFCTPHLAMNMRGKVTVQ